jgi:predicted dinucleotide-utilizing enzyme
LANQEILDKLDGASRKYQHKVYVPCGAFWGALDIRKMADLNTLTGLSVSMKKHPDSLKLENPLKDKLDSYSKDDNNQTPCKIYSGNFEKKILITAFYFFL